MNRGKRLFYLLFTITLFSLFTDSALAQRRGRRGRGWRRRPYYGRSYRYYGGYPYYRRGWYGPGFDIGFGVGPGYRYGGYGPGISFGFGF